MKSAGCQYAAKGITAAWTKPPAKASIVKSYLAGSRQSPRQPGDKMSLS
jgi:hypothetical protein